MWRRRAGLATEGRLPSVQPLSLTPFDSSPSRGASGEEAKLYGMPRPPLARGGGIASAMTERLDDGSRAVSTKKEDPLSELQLREGVFFLVSQMTSSISTFTIYSIPDSPQKSSAVQKVYKRPLRRFAPALPEGEPLAGRVTFHWTPEVRYGAKGRALLQRAAASGQRTLSSCRWPRQRSTAVSGTSCFARPA